MWFDTGGHEPPHEPWGTGAMRVSGVRSFMPDAPRGRCRNLECRRRSPFPFDDYCHDCAYQRFRAGMAESRGDLDALASRDAGVEAVGLS